MIRDDDFLNQLKEGRASAYEVLVERFEWALYRFFLCDHHDHHVAADQTAETFAHLVRSLPRMRGGPGQLRAFVFATARHVQRRRWRAPKRKQHPLEAAHGVSATGPSPHRRVAQRERLEHVLEAIARLEQPAPSVLVLRFVEGLSIDEVAAALEMPAGTVKSHIHRARARLKQQFADEGCES